MGAYVFISRLGKMPVLEHLAYGVQIWTLITTRKAHKCAICQSRQETGAHMYCPITNATNRWERICPDCMAVLTSGQTSMSDNYTCGT